MIILKKFTNYSSFILYTNLVWCISLNFCGGLMKLFKNSNSLITHLEEVRIFYENIILYGCNEKNLKIVLFLFRMPDSNFMKIFLQKIRFRFRIKNFFKICHLLKISKQVIFDFLKMIK